MSNRFQLLEKEISAYCTAVARERERTQKIKMQVRLMENWVKSCIECQINLCATSCRRLQSSSDPTMICESHYYSTYNFSARIFSFRVVHSKQNAVQTKHTNSQLKTFARTFNSQLNIKYYSSVQFASHAHATITLHVHVH